MQGPVHATSHSYKSQATDHTALNSLGYITAQIDDAACAQEKIRNSLIRLMYMIQLEAEDMCMGPVSSAQLYIC